MHHRVLWSWWVLKITFADSITCQMMRSQVQGESKESSSRVSMTRTSKTGWLQDYFHPVIGKLTKRVSHYTGLETDTFLEASELLQVQNKLASMSSNSDFLSSFGRHWLCGDEIVLSITSRLLLF